MKRSMQKGFYPDRIDDRRGDYWYFGGGGVAGLSDYTKRAKMAEVVLAASACRTSVTETYQTTNNPASFLPAVIGVVNWPLAQWSTKYVASVQTNATSGISVSTGLSRNNYSGHSRGSP